MPHTPSGPRTVALVGPYGSGKSTLFDALLAAAGGPARRGAAPRGGTRIAHCTYLDEPWALIDCPGSVELAHEAEAALAVADIAVVVCDPDPVRAPTVAPLLRRLDELGMPAMVFVNRIDTLRRPGARHAGRPAGADQAPAGAARGADPRRRGDHRLCRCGQRARLSLPPRRRRPS